MSCRLWIITLWIALWLLTGCTTAPTLDVEEWYSKPVKQAFAAKREQLARGYESSGSLQPALQEWFAISAVFPHAAEPQMEIQRLQQMISSRVEKYRRLAQDATARSDYAKAQLRYLQLLALQPDNQDAAKALKNLTARAGYARLASAPKISGKVAQAHSAPATGASGKVVPEITDQDRSAKRDAQGGSGLQADDSGGKSNLELGLKHLSDKQYESALARFLLARRLKQAPVGLLNKHIVYTRSMLAEQHYDDGVNAFRMARYELAVSEFKKALEYNPQHEKARLYLGSASQMRERLAPSR